MYEWRDLKLVLLWGYHHKNPENGDRNRLAWGIMSLKALMLTTVDIPIALCTDQNDFPAPKQGQLLPEAPPLPLPQQRS